MTYDEELTSILKNKNFKTFWDCLDFLLLAGFSMIESFGVAMKSFGNRNVFSDVAFARCEKDFVMNENHFTRGLVNASTIGQPGQWQTIDPMTGIMRIVNVDLEAPATYNIVVGLIDDTNVHLSRLYSVYRKWVAEGKMPDPQHEIEATTQVIRIKGLSLFIVDYLELESQTHFGYNMFKINRTDVLSGKELLKAHTLRHHDNSTIEDNLRQGLDEHGYPR